MLRNGREVSPTPQKGWGRREALNWPRPTPSGKVSARSLPGSKMAALEARAGARRRSRVRGGACTEGAGRGGALGRAGGRGCRRSVVAGREAAAVAGLRGRGRIRSGAMSVDKAELCGSLLTWVGRRRGQGQVSARPFRLGSQALAWSTFLLWG